MRCCSQVSFFFPMSVSRHQNCKLCSLEPARDLPNKPKDASLAPPSGKTEVITGVASGPLLGEKKRSLSTC